MKESPEIEPQGFQSYQRQCQPDTDNSAISQPKSRSMTNQRSSPFTPRLEQMTATDQPKHKTTLSQEVHELLRFSVQQHLKQPDLKALRGKPLNFLTVKKNFRCIVEDRTKDPSRRLELLLRYTKGEPHEPITKGEPAHTCTALIYGLCNSNEPIGGKLRVDH